MAFHVDIDALAGSTTFARVQPIMPTSSSDKLFFYDYIYGSETYEWAPSSTQIAPGAVIVGTTHAPCGVTRYIVVSVKNARLTLAAGPLVKHVSIANVKRNEQA